MNILITGGSNGIGKATAQKLQEEGHKPIVFDTKEPDYEVGFYEGDVRDEERVESVVDEVDFDVSVNCAGFYELGSIEDMSSETVEKIFNTNVHGYLNFIRHSMTYLRENDGRIVNISSVAGKVSMPFFGAYCSSKHAVESISDSLRRESSVDVVVVEPGVVETGFNRRAREALEKYVPDSIYSDRYDKMLNDGGMSGVDAERAAETVYKAVVNEKPRRRYHTPFRAKIIVLASLLPGFVKERIFEKVMK